MRPTVFLPALAVVALAAGLGTCLPAGAQEALEVTAGALNVRRGPSTGYGILGLSHQGEVYASFERSGEWRRIWFDGGAGWVHGSYTRGSGASLRRVTAAALNVRTGPGTQYARIGGLPAGYLVAVSGSSGEWARISFAGRAAWVHAGYLAAVGGSSAPPPSGGGSQAPSSGLPRSARGFVQLPASGAGFYSYTSSDRRWGRDYFVYGILRIGQDWAGTGRPRMGTGDVSLANGGSISGHVSHQKGVDVDVRLVKTAGEGPGTMYDASYSRTGTQALIDLYYRHTPVTLIFFNDSRVRGVRYWDGHHNHFHVRVVER